MERLICQADNVIPQRDISLSGRLHLEQTILIFRADNCLHQLLQKRYEVDWNCYENVQTNFGNTLIKQKATGESQGTDHQMYALD